MTSVAIVGPTRSGKTAECAIPGVLDWVGPAILLSVKRDLLDTTIARRRQLGQVRVFDPGGLLGAQREPRRRRSSAGELARWSPLRNADTATGAKRAGEAMAAWTPQAGVDGGMDFWTSQGKLLFTGLLGAAALSEQRSMRAVAQWVFNMTMPGVPGGCEPEAILRRAIKRPGDQGGAPRRRRCTWRRSGTSPTTGSKSSVYATAVTVVRSVARPARHRRHRPRPTTAASGSISTGCSTPAPTATRPTPCTWSCPTTTTSGCPRSSPGCCRT